MQIELF